MRAWVDPALAGVATLAGLAITITDDATPYDALTVLAVALPLLWRRSRPLAAAAALGAGMVISAYSPQKTDDFVAMALSRIDRYEPGCVLKVANLSISSSRPAVLSELLRIRALGCRVQFAFSTAYGVAVRRLLFGRVELRKPCRTTIHSKMMLYKGRYDGVAGRTLVWGGSHNWTGPALRRLDDVFVAISRLGIYENYRAYFKVIWDRSTPVAINLNRCRQDAAP